jgi:hypothetical protein
MVGDAVPRGVSGQHVLVSIASSRPDWASSAVGMFASRVTRTRRAHEEWRWA